MNLRVFWNSNVSSAEEDVRSSITNRDSINLTDNPGHIFSQGPPSYRFSLGTADHLWQIFPMKCPLTADIQPSDSGQGEVGLRITVRAMSGDHWASKPLEEHENQPLVAEEHCENPLWILSKL